MGYFIFDSKNSDDYDIIVNQVSRPLLPALRERKLIIPGKDGAWDFGNNTYDESSVVLSCSLLKPLSQRELTRQIAQWLSTKSNLYISDELDKYYFGRIYDTSFETVGDIIARFQLVFIVDPYAYAAFDAYNEIYYYDVDWLLDVGYIYPNENTFNWLYIWHSMGLYNHSETQTDIKITITGSTQGIKITHVESGNILDLSTIISGETVIIDTEAYTIEKATGENLLGDLSPTSEFFNIQAGANSFIFEGIDPNCVVNYEWKHKFL